MFEGGASEVCPRQMNLRGYRFLSLSRASTLGLVKGYQSGTVRNQLQENLANVICVWHWPAEVIFELSGW